MGAHEARAAVFSGASWGGNFAASVMLPGVDTSKLSPEQGHIGLECIDRNKSILGRVATTDQERSPEVTFLRN